MTAHIIFLDVVLPFQILAFACLTLAATFFAETWVVQVCAGMTILCAAFKAYDASQRIR